MRERVRLVHFATMSEIRLVIMRSVYCRKRSMLGVCNKVNPQTPTG
jgi:hypothetical protein